jgi:hypothetical protein
MVRRTSGAIFTPGPGIVDLGQIGVGVAPLPLEQPTHVGAFGP